MATRPETGGGFSWYYETPDVDPEARRSGEKALEFACRDLSLDPRPEIRWLREACADWEEIQARMAYETARKSSQMAAEPSFKAAAGRKGWVRWPGSLLHNRIWVLTGQTPDETARTVLHEGRHLKRMQEEGSPPESEEEGELWERQAEGYEQNVRWALRDPDVRCEMSRKSFDLEIKAFNDQTGAFTGLAAVYGNEDLVGDIVERGAFAETVKENPVVPILWQHDTREPIGKGRLKDTYDGLLIEGKLSLGVQKAREARELMQDEAVRGLSIGYDTVNSFMTGSVRHLTEIKLWEVSVVTFAANPEARISAVKGHNLDFLDRINWKDPGVMAEVTAFGRFLDQMKARSR